MVEFLPEAFEMTEFRGRIDSRLNKVFFLIVVIDVVITINAFEFTHCFSRASKSLDLTGVIF